MSQYNVRQRLWIQKHIGCGFVMSIKLKKKVNGCMDESTDRHREKENQFLNKVESQELILQGFRYVKTQDMHGAEKYIQ